MAVYLTIYAVLAILAMVANARNKNAILVAIAVFLTVFTGLRYETGCDFAGYLHRFHLDLNPMLEGGPLSSDEWLFGWIMQRFQQSGRHYVEFLFFMAIIITTCFVIFAAKFRESVLIIALLFPIMVIQLAMSGVRQATATALLMVAGIAFARKQPVLFVLLILIGAEFHRSVILFLPAILLIGRTISPLKILLAALVAIPASTFLLADRFETYSERYIQQIYGDNDAAGGLLRFLLTALTASPFIWRWREVKDRFPVVYPLLQLFALVIVSCLPLIFVSTVALHRINYYVMPFAIVIFVYSMLSIRSEVARQQMKIGILALYGLYSLVWFSLSSHADRCYVPYQTILSVDDIVVETELTY